VLVGLDGWHLPRSALDALPDPVLARSKRGAHWTFDGAAYAEFVKQLRRDVARPYAAIRSSWNADDPAQAGSAALIMAPSFDHAVKDPVENTVVIGPHHRVRHLCPLGP
jgi:pantothenate kinase